MRNATLAVLLLAFVTVAVPVAEAGTVDRIENARSIEVLDKLRAKAEPRIRKGDEDYRLLSALARAYARFGRADTGVALLERHEAKFKPGQVYALRTLRIDLLADAGRMDEAIRVATTQLGEASSKKDVFHCHQRLGRLYERKEDWQQGLEHYSADLPPFHCATCEDALTTLRNLGIIRCRFQLGQVEQALDALFTMMVAVDEKGRAPTHTGRLFCEYSARSERLAEAKTRIAKLGEKSREELGILAAIAEAFAQEDPAALVDLVDAPRDNRLRSEWTAMLLFELGDPAIELMEKRVAAGSVPAYELCRYSDSDRLLAALEKRLEAEEDAYARSRLTWALERLRGTTR